MYPSALAVPAARRSWGDAVPLAPAHDLIAPLRVFGPDAPVSGFRGVYPRPSGRWVARVKRGGRLGTVGTAGTPHQAAVLLARWYAQEYGPDWVRVLWPVKGGSKVETRRRNAWQAVENGEGGWVAVVWEWGRRRVLGPHVHPREPRKDKKCGDPWVFPSYESCRLFVQRWRATTLVNRWGYLAGWALYR